MKLKPYQVITLLHPKKDEEETNIISKDIELILAADEKQAGLLAARSIPDAQIKNLSRIEVIVRPF